jgi:ribosomal protein S18 acetylase RimI-like enzyme
VIEVKPVDQADPEMAERIHAVQMAAYAQEALLVGAKRFPLLEKTAHDVQVSGERYFGAFDGELLVGVVCVDLDDDPKVHNIASLVVDPARQREGIASRLMQTVLEKYGVERITVQTAAKNLPALALYKKFGFVECQRWAVGEEALELVRLLRPGDNAESGKEY